MKLIATLMVRDEADIIAAMIEHHIAQGIDLIIATDNGSVDGTTDVLKTYAELGVVELHHDPVHRKQQHQLVTNMARRARTEYAADWVINADADEFWAPRDKRLTLRSALEQIPLSLNAFTVPVTNLVGPPVLRGSVFERLTWRDLRSQSQLNEIGIYAQPTDNCVHRGESDIVVSQGNHFVSLASNGQPDDEYAIETLHLPWRSWAQFEQKVVHTGRAYEANPDLRPSKNHHGMADYRRHLGGRLFAAYLLRQPLESELELAEKEGWLVRDSWLLEYLRSLTSSALCPELLRAALDTSHTEPVEPQRHQEAADLARQFMDLERERDAALRVADDHAATARRLATERDRALKERDRARTKIAALEKAAKQSTKQKATDRTPPASPTFARRVRRGLRRRARRMYRAVRRRVRAAAPGKASADTR